MWEFSVPPHKGDDHFELGIWHPNALPFDRQNKEGYHELQRRFDENDCTSEADEAACKPEIEGRQPSEAESAIESFTDEVTALVDALPDQDVSARTWSIVLRYDPLFRLISLWPSVAIELAPAIAESAMRHGLVYYDPQSDVVTLPESKA
jgi:hypothetical protein